MDSTLTHLVQPTYLGVGDDSIDVAHTTGNVYVAGGANEAYGSSTVACLSFDIKQLRGMKAITPWQGSGNAMTIETLTGYILVEGVALGQ